MRQILAAVCLTILLSTGIAVAGETARVDAADTVGIRVSTEIDPADPRWVRCTIDWLGASDDARVSVLGPADVVSADVPAQHTGGAESWSSEPLRVVEGDHHELLLSLRRDAVGRPLAVIAERSEGDVVLQASVDLVFDGSHTRASQQASVRVTHQRLDDRRGVILAEHLAPKLAPKATIDVSDNNDYPIQDGPTDCSSGSVVSQSACRAQPLAA